CPEGVYPSVFRGKADTAFCSASVRSFQSDMPFRLTPSRATVRIATMPCESLGGDNEATRLLYGCERGGRVAACCARAAGGDAGGRVLKWSVAHFGFPLGSGVQSGAERSGLRQRPERCD